VKEAVGIYESRWASCLRRHPAADLRLMCLPYAGGGAGIYRAWAEQFSQTIEVWPLHLPGRERRITEEPIPSISELVAAIAEGIRPLLQGKFAFFGHSMGGLLSFELARYLRRQGLPGPQCVVISGLKAPHIPNRRKPTAHLPDADLIEELHKLNGTPPEVLVHPELIELLLPVVRADFQAIETYSFVDDAPLSCPMFVYGGLSDPEASREDLEEWEQHTSNAFSLRLFPGDHFYLHSHRAKLTATLARDLQGILHSIDSR
jgi:medium-chain acyl-[acyl-carrier-protein] hydrolase